ncbi:MAG: hypothetical protein HC817_14330 [Saprospiraceae bacterium]|nr:hypothetical protein [Saprospiraceae bacterium]
MEFLSEDSIKRATLAFLKTYYKFRPRNGETVVSEDRMHSSGIIVDGYLEFPNENGSPFVATFESTSSFSSSEVRFSLQRQQLLWDSLAVSSILTLTVMLTLWFEELWSVTQMGWVFTFMAITTLMTIFVIIFHFLCRKAGRYRYIYAIEQFKQYHADEQWIAVGYDVFRIAATKILPN